MNCEICPDEKYPNTTIITELIIIIAKKLNKILFLFDILSCEAQKFIIAVSNAKRHIVKRYCQKDSSKFIFAIASDENLDVYNGMSMKEINFAVTLLSP